MSLSPTGTDQAGVVLLVSLLVLLVMGVIATTVARSNLLQLHMAGNDEARLDALQGSLSIVDAVIARSSNTSVAGGVGYRNCLAGATDNSCDTHSLSVDRDALPVDGVFEVSVLRVAPEIGRLPIWSQASASSTVHYRVAKLEVQVSYSPSRQRAGQAAVAQGVLVRLPVSVAIAGDGP